MEDEYIKSNITLRSLAIEVLKKYGISPDKITIIQSGGIKTVWKIQTGERLFCLKRLKQSYDKALFSVNAQVFIKESGGNVPCIIRNNNDQPIVKYNDQLFVLYEWLQGKQLDFGKPDDLHMAVQGLARFHKASKRYMSAENCRVSTKLLKWPDQYSSMRTRMSNWKNTAKNNKSVSCNSTYLNCVDAMLNIADYSLDLLNNSKYRQLASADSPYVVLCHQDYGPGNVISTDSEVIVLDLDGVTYDLPSRDLRKIIGKLSEKKNSWDENTIKTIIDWYGSINPICQKEKEVLYIDLMFPHWFFGLLKNRYDKKKTVKSSEIQKISRLEQSKVPLLEKLIKRL